MSHKKYIDFPAGTYDITKIFLQADATTGTLEKINLPTITPSTGTTNRIEVTSGVIDISSAFVGQNSITTLGTITIGIWNASTIGTTNGGTGLTSYTTGDILYASATNALSKLAVSTNGYVLTLVGGIPAWAIVDSLPSQSGNSGKYLTTNGTSASWSALIGATAGGTGLSSYATGDLLYASATNTLSKLAASTNGYVLTLVSGLPAWAIVDSLPSQSGNSGKYLTTNGTSTSWSALSGWSTTGNSGLSATTNFIGNTDAVDLVFKVNNTAIMRQFASTRNVVIQDGGTFTDAGYRLDVIGATRLDGIIIQFVAGSPSGSLRIGGTIGASSNRCIAIGGSSTGTFSLAVGIETTSTLGGTAIGGYQTISTAGIAIGCASTPTTSSGTNAIAIGYGVSSYGSGSAIGYSSSCGTSSGNSTGVGIHGRVAAGIGNYGIAIFGYCGANYSVAIGGSTSASREFVCGAAYAALDYTNYVISDVYFGSGKSRYNTNNTQSNGNGVGYTINGSGAYGTDFAGGSITIAGGKGTGTGVAGDIIFSVSAVLTTGTTLQSLTQKWWIKGNTGTFSNNSTPNASAIIQIDSTTKGSLLPRMTTAQKNAITSPLEGLEIYDSSLHKKCVYTGSAWETITSA